MDNRMSDKEGKVVGVSVSGSGKDRGSVELILRFKPNDGSGLAAYRLGAEAACQQFLGAVALATHAYEKDLDVIISVNEEATPTILCIALPNKE
ncbi:hypothetical protein [Undibacterium sp. TJN19]|uniref:hypothetical protein n=1 Tax=Undibacterium sp. TJN19 TaxID=3413055 RepID=UPI003BF0BF08